MDELVLDTVKNFLGPMLYGSDFDAQLLSLINIQLLPLTQIGAIKDLNEPIDEGTTWEDIIKPVSENVLGSIKAYVSMKVKLLFDPPVSGIVKIFEESINEHEWRIKEYYDLLQS